MQKKSLRYTMTKSNLIYSIFDTKPNSQWYINIDSKNPTIPFTPLTVRNTLRGLGLPLYQMDDFITLDSHTCIFRSFESNPSEKNKILRNIEIYSDSFKISCVMFNAKW